MDNSLVCQTSVIDPIGTLQHALETNNVSCKLLSFCSVVETKVDRYLLSLQILCYCKIRLHLWNILWILGLKGAFVSWFLVSFFSIHLYQPTPFPSAHNLCSISDPAMIIIILLWVTSNLYLLCIDVELVLTLCHTHGVLACIDETFATPVTQLALTLDADLVLSSATKIPCVSQWC